jgi:nucleoside-diphosphate-sugar epimerase
MVRLVKNPETRKALRTVPMVATAEKVARSMMDYVPDNVLQFAKRAAGSGNGTSQSGNGLSGPSKPPTIPLSEHDVRFFTCNVVFSIEKARKLLGYEPEVEFAEGMRRTAEWIKWMKL